MERATWTDDFELQGAAREQAVTRIRQVLDGWGLLLPGDPMLMHFGLHDFENIGETEFWIVNDTTEQLLRQIPLHVRRPALPAPLP